MQKLWEPYFSGIFGFGSVWGKMRPKIGFLGFLKNSVVRIY